MWCIVFHCPFQICPKTSIETIGVQSCIFNYDKTLDLFYDSPLPLHAFCLFVHLLWTLGCTVSKKKYEFTLWNNTVFIDFVNNLFKMEFFQKAFLPW